jgi:hypothetical protein
MAALKCPECKQPLSPEEYAEALKNAMIPHIRKDGTTCPVCLQPRKLPLG